MEFQYRPHIVDTDTIADAVFAGSVSQTSIIQKSVRYVSICETRYESNLVCPTKVLS